MSKDTIPLVGEQAPDFQLPAADGREIRLAGLRGKWVVLYFYPKDNTSGCTTEALEFTALLPEFKALGAEVLGVSKDSLASHQKFIAKHDLGVPLLADPERIVLESYGAWQLKKMCGKESMGTVRGTVIIDPEGIVRHAWPKVAKAAGHAQKVLDTLRELAG